MLSQQIPQFRCEVTPDRDSVRVAPTGEMDMSTVGVVERELRAAAEAGFGKIVLDLSGLVFMDSTGLHLACRWSTAAARDGFEFEVEPGPYAVQRVFELADLGDEVRFKRS